jgi:cysteine desulfurase
MPSIYLDNNATTMMSKEVAEAIHQCHLDGLANTASAHARGRAARRRLEACRDELTRWIGGETSGMGSDRLLLTSGGTESNNLALAGLAAARKGQIIISSLEHPSIETTAKWLESRGRRVVRLPANSAGVTCYDRLPALLKEPTAVVSVIWANNETGVIQPISAIAAVCEEAGVPLHTDAVQAVGKIPLHFTESRVSAMTFNAHKLHGPRGVGGLLIKPDVEIEPILHGGFQQMGLRPGTESIALAVGLGRAINDAMVHFESRQAAMKATQRRFEALIAEQLHDAIVIGGESQRLPHTSCIAFPGANRQALLMALDMAGVACSTGSACASGSSDPSPTLLAMNLDRSLVGSALRFSSSFMNSLSEVEQAAEHVAAAVRQARK